MHLRPVVEDVKKSWVTANEIKHQWVSKGVSANPADCMRHCSLRHSRKCMNIRLSAGKMMHQDLLTGYSSFVFACIHLQTPKGIIVITRAFVCNPNVAKGMVWWVSSVDADHVTKYTRKIFPMLIYALTNRANMNININTQTQSASYSDDLPYQEISNTLKQVLCAKAFIISRMASLSYRHSSI